MVGKGGRGGHNGQNQARGTFFSRAQRHRSEQIRQPHPSGCILHPGSKLTAAFLIGHLPSSNAIPGSAGWDQSEG